MNLGNAPGGANKQNEQRSCNKRGPVKNSTKPVILREPTEDERLAFCKNRNNFVKNFELWNKPPPDNRPTPFNILAIELEMMSKVVKNWIDMRETWQLHACFFPKCHIIKAALDSLVMQMRNAKQARPGLRYDQGRQYFHIAQHIGSLTLSGHTEADTYSVKYVRFAEKLQNRWLKSPLDLGGPLLFEHWNKLYYKDRSCRCRQCRGAIFLD